MPSSISEYIINARRFKPKTSENEIVIGVTNRLAKDILLGGNKKWKTHLKYLLLDLCARYRETPPWLDILFKRFHILYNSSQLHFTWCSLQTINSCHRQAH